MPIYEYECTACGDLHEIMQKITEDPLTDCPSCGQPALKKLISAAGFRLSGTGWYETDFKRSRQRNLTEKESKESKESKEAKNSKDSGDSKNSAKPKEANSSKADKSSTASQSGGSAKPAATGS
jgi:putative FmdB family regulatory protein